MNFILKDFWLRALERIDRLLLITHGKKRAGLLFAAFGVILEKGIRQRVNNLPLSGRGILRLVEQDMLYAAIQLIAHPIRDLCAAEKITHKMDLVIKV